MAGGYISLRNGMESIDTLLEMVKDSFKRVVSMHLDKEKEVAS